MVNCKICGREIKSTTSSHSLCQECMNRGWESNPPKIPIIYNPGWVCPKCGSVYGPFVNECMRCNGGYKITCNGV